MLNRHPTRIFMHRNGIGQSLLPDDPEMRADYEALIRDDYERCHPRETLEHLKIRARFSKEDQGLLDGWMKVAASRARQAGRR